MEGTPGAKTPRIELNPGLVTIIGGRGSGKTAFSEILATACDAYDTPDKSRSSFLERAKEHLAGAEVALQWKSGGDPVVRPLDAPVNTAFDAYDRARYLSQQFVEELCSIEGMPRLIREIERVVFDAHTTIDRDGAVDFDELLDLRARAFRDGRTREEASLANVSEQIGSEMEKSRTVAAMSSRSKRRISSSSGASRIALRVPPPVAKPGRRRMKLIVTERGDAAEQNLALVRAVVRVRAWADKLISGEVRSVAEISQNGRFCEAYVPQASTTFLPPSAVEQIVDPAAHIGAKRGTGDPEEGRLRHARASYEQITFGR